MTKLNLFQRNHGPLDNYCWNVETIISKYFEEQPSETETVDGNELCERQTLKIDWYGVEILRWQFCYDVELYNAFSNLVGLNFLFNKWWGPDFKTDYDEHADRYGV